MSVAPEIQRLLRQGSATATVRAATHVVRDEYVLSGVSDGYFGVDIGIPELPNDGFIGRFSQRAMEDATAVLGLSQTNPVLSSGELVYEPTPERRRRYVFDDVTPPCFVSESIAKEVAAGRTIELGFCDERFGGARMRLGFEDEGSRPLTFSGRPLRVPTVRYQTNPGEPHGALEVAEGTAILMRVEREAWFMELLSVS